MIKTLRRFTFMRTDSGALAAAEHLLAIACEEGKRLTPMQVLKLIYISHGWMLALHGRPLFGDEVKAWKYGPVIPAVYQRYSDYGRLQVDAHAERCERRNDRLDDDQRGIIGQVLEKYGEYTGLQLSDMTHEDDSPWDITRREGMRTIPNDLIQGHYRELYDKLTHKAGAPG